MSDIRIERPPELDGAASSWFASLAGLRLRHKVSSGLGALFWLLFAYANIKASVESHRVLGAGVGVLGLWAAVLFLVRRPPQLVSRRIPEWLVAFAGTFGASLLRPGGANPGWIDPLGLTLQGLGIALGVCGYLALGRSLGLVPAHRGLVTSGIYRVVRHPLYASYVVAELGYLVQSPRLWNLGILVVVWACQIARIVSEERLLSSDWHYRLYSARTRWRLLPGVW
jgi:protein-S-isoprenylcysteine O-methyltransferase Ste14